MPTATVETTDSVDEAPQNPAAEAIPEPPEEASEEAKVSAPAEPRSSTPFRGKLPRRRVKEIQERTRQAQEAGVKHLPRPPAFKIAQPAQFFKYWEKIHREFPNRVTVYVYRLWPLIDRSRTNNNKNIDKCLEPFALDDMAHRYGSGDYNLQMSDAQLSKSVCMTTLNHEHAIRDKDRPPILDLKELDTSDPINRSFVQQLQAKGLLSADGVPIAQEDSEMAGSNTAVEAVAGMMEQVLDQNKHLTEQMVARTAGDRAAAQPAAAGLDAAAGATALDLVAKGAAMGQKMIADAQERVEKAQAPDPLILADRMIEMAAKMQPDGSGDEVVKTLLANNAELARQVAQIQTDRIAAQERTIERIETRMQTAATAQTTAAAAQAPAQPKGLLEQLREINSIGDEARKLLGGGDDEEDDGRGGRDGGLTGMLPTILTGLTALGSVVVAGLHNYAVVRSGQGATVPPSVATPELPGVTAAGALPDGARPQGQQQPGRTEEEVMMQSYYQFLERIRRPLMRYLDQGRSGADFADLLVDMEGEATYQQIVQAGATNLLQLIQSYAPLWGQVQATVGEQRLIQFIGEFLNPEPVEVEEKRPKVRVKPVVTAVKGTAPGPDAPAAA